MDNEPEITIENCRLLLTAFMEKNNIASPNLAKAFGCSHATLCRVLTGITIPTEEFLKQSGILFGLGFKNYSKLSKADKETISQKMGATAGGALGFAAIAGAISASGTVAGLSAAGITSGLAALGALIGGGMILGVTVAAAIPIAAGALGFALVTRLKHKISEGKLNKVELDSKWELEKPEQ